MIWRCRVRFEVADDQGADQRLVKQVRTPASSIVRTYLAVFGAGHPFGKPGARAACISTCHAAVHNVAQTPY